MVDTTRLFALSVWQPWASLIVAGLKRYEYRDIPAPADYHERYIAIHASVRNPSPPDLRALQYEVEKTKGITRCGLRLLPHELDQALDIIRKGRSLPRGALIGTAWLGVPVRAGDLHENVPPLSGFKIDPEKWAWPVFPARKQPSIEQLGARGFFPVNVPKKWLDP